MIETIVRIICFLQQNGRKWIEGQPMAPFRSQPNAVWEHPPQASIRRRPVHSTEQNDPNTPTCCTRCFHSYFDFFTTSVIVGDVTSNSTLFNCSRHRSSKSFTSKSSTLSSISTISGLKVPQFLLIGTKMCRVHTELQEVRTYAIVGTCVHTTEDWECPINTVEEPRPKRKIPAKDKGS